MVATPEVGPRVVLAFLDDRAADRARALEQFEQRVAIAIADGALEGGEMDDYTRAHLADLHKRIERALEAQAVIGL